MQERLFLCPLCRDRGQDILNVFMKQLTEHDKVAPFVALQSKKMNEEMVKILDDWTMLVKINQ